LKAQVERLTIELKEYRKRLSFIGSASGGISRSPTAPSGLSTAARNGANNNHNDFQFEFPKFGDLPGAHIFNNGSFAKVQQDKKASKQSAPTANYSMPGVVSRNPPSSSSPRGQAPNYGSTGNSPIAIVNRTSISSTKNYSNARESTGIDGLQDLFSPSILESVSRNSSYDYMSHPGSSTTLNQTTLAQNNANNTNYHAQTNGSSSVSNTDSPSASSESQPGNASSIGTSPEPSLNSPTTKLNEFGLNTINEEHSAHDIYGGETNFCKRLSLACGNSTNPVPRATSLSNGRDPLGPTKTPASEINGIDWLAQQNGGQFDPVLFGGYRDPQEAVIGQDFGSFFNDAFPLPDIGSPFNNYNAEITSPLPAPKRDLMKEIEETQDGAEEEVVPGEDRSKMLSCNKIWYVYAVLFAIFHCTDEYSFRDRLQSMDSFQNGELDMDNLCTQLRTKAKCSETGAVVGEKDVDEILRRAKAAKATQAL
jgi:AP-1-like transcription factor